MNKYLPKQYISTFDPLEISNTQTILGNDKKAIIKKLTTGIQNRNITDALNSAIELHCSGYFEIVFKKLLHYYYNEINMAQPQFIKYISTFSKYYKTKYDCKSKTKHPLSIVNEIPIRNFTCFFTTLLTMSGQRKLLKLDKIKPDDFIMSKHKKHLISSDLNLVYKFVNKTEPKEIIIPLSEICNYLENTSILDREHRIVYWISWLLEYEKIYHNKNLLVDVRDIPGVSDKYHRDFIWIIWNIIKYFTNPTNVQYVDNLFSLFIDDYTRGTKRARVNLVIMAVLFIINPLPGIEFPIEPISKEQYKQSTLHSLRCNKYYLTLFKNKTYSQL